MSVISNLCLCVCVCVCVRALHLTRLLTSTVIRILVTSVMNEYEALVIGEKRFPVALCTPQLPHWQS